MIRITITLHSALDGSQKTLGVMDICNLGESQNQKRGHYHGRLYRKGAIGRVQRTGRVSNYPRQSYVVWRLVLRMLRQMFPEEG